jgi:transcriptional regulator with XRE-family HTH domain
VTHINALPRSIGERIIWARKRKGLSQERLALNIGTSRRHMIRLEKNLHAPGPVYRQKLAEALDQPPEMFSDDEDDEEADMSLDHVLRLHIRRIIREEATA